MECVPVCLIKLADMECGKAPLLYSTDSCPGVRQSSLCEGGPAGWSPAIDMEREDLRTSLNCTGACIEERPHQRRYANGESAPPGPVCVHLRGCTTGVGGVPMRSRPGTML